MEANLKKILRSVSLELRHILEGRYDEHGHFHPGDLERRLNEIGIWKDRPAKPVEEMQHLSDEDRSARTVIDAYILFREEAGVSLVEAFAEFVRESAYTWANRLIALRCMEARAIIDEVILQKEAYGGRSMVHNRLARKHPEICSGEDDGLFVVLYDQFQERFGELPTLFNPKSPAVALRPSVAALKRCITLLSGRETVRGQDPASDDVFSAPDALGWAYQYWNAEEKDRVFEMIRTQKGTKIDGADIIPATQLYTEPYMVKFLVQNSLGAIWMGMHPESQLCEGWEYYVKDADRVNVDLKPVREIAFLDPAVGSGHFLLEGFDLIYAMYEEEGELVSPEEICASILNNNLFGIDIDGRAVQIAAAALWMKAKEIASNLKASDISGFGEHLIATNIRLPKNKNHLELFLMKHPEDEPLRPALETIFKGLENAHELGSLLQIEEPVEHTLKDLKNKDELEKAQLYKSSQGVFWDTKPQSVLPFNAEDWNDWQGRVIEKLKRHFSEESEAADLTQAFFGFYVKHGFAFFDIMKRKYDVVSANPPYMGSVNMGLATKTYCQFYYKDSKYDLYSVFIDRCLSLLCKNGYTSIVSQETWLTSQQFSDLRTRILSEYSFNLLAHLGPHGFSEISGGKVSTALVVLSNSNNANNYITSYNLSDYSNSIEKDKNLIKCVNGELKGRTYVTKLIKFQLLPKTPIAYWASDKLLDLLAMGKNLNDIVSNSNFTKTGNNDRYLRFYWEVSHNQLGEERRWIWTSKGVRFCRWQGSWNVVVDWSSGSRIFYRSDKVARITDEEYWGKTGVTYCTNSTLGLAFRMVTRPGVSTYNSPVIFSTEDYLWFILALLNSRFSTYVTRLIGGPLAVVIGDIQRIPYSDSLIDSRILFEKYARIAFDNKTNIISYGLDESDFDVNKYITHKSLADLCNTVATDYLASGMMISLTSGMIDKLSIRCLDIDDETNNITRLLGTPPVWNSLISGIEIPSIISDESLCEYLANLPMDNISQERLSSIKEEIRKMYVEGSKFSEEEIDEDDDSDDQEYSSYPIPAESLVEEISSKLNLNTVNVYSIIKSGILGEDWRCVSEEQRITADFFSILVLRLLGHRWPKQIEANDPIPEWADNDGIIPLTEDCGETTLFTRMRDRIVVEFAGESVNAIEQEFNAIIGSNLDKWLLVSFFRRHISQFKKRPIAWHIQSSPFPSSGGRGKASRVGGNSPVFAVLLYYHNIGPTSLLDIRKLYVDKLRVSYETEQRTLEGINQPTTEQASRKIRLECWIDELKIMDKKLEELSREAFGPEKMRPLLRQHAINDAILSLVACWLKRLSNVVHAGPLQLWQEAADKTNLHQKFPQWLHNATARLDHFCNDVRPKAPEEKNLAIDPTSADLAPTISSHAAIMVKSSIAKACDSWWKEFDAAVLLQVRLKINESEDKANLLEEEKELTGCSTTRKMEIERLIKQLKADIKGLKKELSEKTAKAKSIRREMESWQCKEAGLWEGWLATQPLFDKYAQLDATKAAPSTIAEFIAQESAYYPDINNGVRVNIAPLQKAGLLAADVIAAKDLDKAISDRADWRAEERRWSREGKLPQPGWWKAEVPV